MSPIGSVLLRLCDNNMVVDIEQAQTFFPGMDVRRIKVVAIMLGLTINK